MAYEVGRDGQLLRTFDAPTVRIFHATAVSYGGVADGRDSLWIAKKDDQRLFQVDVTKAGTHIASVTEGTTVNRDFGNFQLGSITGTVFDDLNQNGVRDAGEAGLEGWQLWTTTVTNRPSTGRISSLPTTRETTPSTEWFAEITT